MKSTITIHIDGYQSEDELKMDPSDTLAEVKKKLIEKGAKVDPSSRFMAHGRVLEENTPLHYQGIKDRSRLRKIGGIGN